MVYRDCCILHYDLLLSHLLPEGDVSHNVVTSVFSVMLYAVPPFLVMHVSCSVSRFTSS